MLVLGLYCTVYSRRRYVCRHQSRRQTAVWLHRSLRGRLYRRRLLLRGQCRDLLLLLPERLFLGQKVILFGFSIKLVSYVVMFAVFVYYLDSTFNKVYSLRWLASVSPLNTFLSCCLVYTVSPWPWIRSIWDDFACIGKFAVIIIKTIPALLEDSHV